MRPKRGVDHQLHARVPHAPALLEMAVQGGGGIRRQIVARRGSEQNVARRLDDQGLAPQRLGEVDRIAVLGRAFGEIDRVAKRRIEAKQAVEQAQ